MLYLYNCGSRISEISSYKSLLSPLSNPTSLIKIGFSKEELCQISHGDLIIKIFNRENLYDMPRVTISTLGSETDTQQTTIGLLLSLFTKFESDAPRESYDNFPKVSSLR